jgi:hypothetical protein
MPTENTVGKCYTFRGLKFYAKNGYVCLHDEETGEFFVLNRKEFLQRAQALSDEAKRLRQQAVQNPGKGWILADRLELQQAIENMVACCHEAKEQGDRNDPEVAAWFARHRPHKRGRVSMAGAANFSTVLPGNLPLGQNTGKLVTPDFSLGQSPKKLILPGEF